MKQLEARRLNQFFADHMAKASKNWRLDPHLLIEMTCVESVGAITRDTNAESSGNYDHHNKHTCTREQAPKIKAFAKRFKKNSKKGGAQ